MYCPILTKEGRCCPYRCYNIGSTVYKVCFFHFKSYYEIINKKHVSKNESPAVYVMDVGGKIYVENDLEMLSMVHFFKEINSPIKIFHYTVDGELELISYSFSDLRLIDKIHNVYKGKITDSILYKVENEIEQYNVRY